jgi:hypothetical protein
MPVDFPEIPFLDFFGASPVDDLDLSLCDDSLFMDGFNFPESAETSPSTSGRCSPFEDDAFLSFNPLETVHECDSLLSELFEISEQRDTLSGKFPTHPFYSFDFDFALCLLMFKNLVDLNVTSFFQNTIQMIFFLIKGI